MTTWYVDSQRALSFHVPWTGFQRAEVMHCATFFRHHERKSRCGVTSHLTALGAVDDDDAALSGLLQRVQQVLPVGGHVASSIRLQHHAPGRLLQKGPHLPGEGRRDGFRAKTFVVPACDGNTYIVT